MTETKCNHCGTTPLDTVAGLCVTCGEHPAKSPPATDKGILAALQGMAEGLDGECDDLSSDNRRLAAECHSLRRDLESISEAPYGTDSATLRAMARAALKGVA